MTDLHPDKLVEQMLERMVEAYPLAEVNHTVRGTCRFLLEASGIEALQAERDALKEALTESRKLTCDAAETGFAEAECRAIYAHNATITKALNGERM